MSGPMVVVYGAGSIGAYVGGSLLAQRVDVILIGRSRMRERINQFGLQVSDLRGQHITVPRERIVYVEAEQAAQYALAAADLVIVAVKSGATDAVGQMLFRHLKSGAMVVSLQNGMGNARLLRDSLPEHRVLAGMVPFNVVQLPDGRLHRATAGDIMVEQDERWKRWLPVFESAGLRLVQRGDFRRVQWGKLLLNLNNAVNALSDLPLREQLMQRDYREVLALLITEALRTLDAAGIKPVRVGRVAPARLPRLLRLPNGLFRVVAAGMLRMDPEARSSMWEDLEAGRLTEIEELNGAIVRLARRHGVAVPCNEAIVALVHAAEVGGQRSWPAQRLRYAMQAAIERTR